MSRLLSLLIASLVSITPVWPVVAQEASAPANALEEAQRISAMTGRPMFVVAGSST